MHMNQLLHLPPGVHGNCTAKMGLHGLQAFLKNGAELHILSFLTCLAQFQSQLAVPALNARKHTEMPGTQIGHVHACPKNLQ